MLLDAAFLSSRPLPAVLRFCRFSWFDCFCVVLGGAGWCQFYVEALTLLEPQSRFGDTPLKFQVVCPQLSPKRDCGPKRVNPFTRVEHLNTRYHGIMIYTTSLYAHNMDTLLVSFSLSVLLLLIRRPRAERAKGCMYVSTSPPAFCLSFRV